MARALHSSIAPFAACYAMDVFMKKPFFLLPVLLAAACAGEPEDAAPVMVKAVEGRTGQVLYAPANFRLSITTTTYTAGFRAEDVSREALAAVIETSAERLGLPLGRSADDFTSPVNAQAALAHLLNAVRGNITAVLPLSNPNETAGDWSITPVATGVTQDIYGNTVVYGRYALAYKPIYQLRSSQMFRYLAALLLSRDWSDFPKSDTLYFAAGKNAVQFVIALSLHKDSGYYTGTGQSHKVGLAFAAVPENKKSPEVWNLVDDLVTFKTLGHVRDALVHDTTVLEVPPRGGPVDIVVAVDRNPSMRRETTIVRETVAELAALLLDEPTFDYHVAFVTQGSADFVRLQDGTRYLSADSEGVDALADKALDSIFADILVDAPVDPDLVRWTALASTAPAATGVNKSFFRQGAKRLLVLVTDRDDHSAAPDGTPLASPDAFVDTYAKLLRPYERFIVAPQRACDFERVQSSEAATYLNYWAAIEGGELTDLCYLAPGTLAQEIFDWADDNGSVFQYGAPQPFPFTLGVSVNGKQLKAEAADGFNYDEIADRIVFRPTATPKPGDTVRASFYRLEPFVQP